MTPRAVRLALAAALPWAAVAHPGGGYAVFAFGWIDPTPPRLVTLPGYLFALGGPVPPAAEAWLLAAACLGCALASAALSAVGREDRRLTAGLLGLAGVGMAAFGARLTLAQAGVTAIPVGAPVLWGVAWFDWVRRCPEVR